MIELDFSSGNIYIKTCSMKQQQKRSGVKRAYLEKFFGGKMYAV
jgi:hypothetical protein